MKFAHEFREILDSGDYPASWLGAAIPYTQLKRSLKQVQQELIDYGLDKGTLALLLAPQESADPYQLKPAARYKLVADGAHPLRSRLSVYLHVRDGHIVDSGLSPASRNLLERLSSAQSRRLGEAPASTAVHECTGSPPRALGSLDRESSQISQHPADQCLQRIEVPLVLDGEFLSTLHADVSGLDVLQADEQHRLEQDIASLGNDISILTTPARFSKSDLTYWREIFELYLDARVFFSSCEQDHGFRTSAVALQHLVSFQQKVAERDIIKNLRLPDSRVAYSRFLALNASLLQNLKFQELNRIAVMKILKKFDKRTSLGASQAFLNAAGSQRFLSETVAKNMCAGISKEILSVVPRLDDYTCPICYSIAWLPIRLQCTHLFCVRCIIKMQRDEKDCCPLCRDKVVMRADMTNLDANMEKFLKTYFKSEIKEKQRANEIERGVELFGDSYRHSSCAMM